MQRERRLKLLGLEPPPVEPCKEDVPSHTLCVGGGGGRALRRTEASADVGDEQGLDEVACTLLAQLHNTIVHYKYEAKLCPMIRSCSASPRVLRASDLARPSCWNSKPDSWMMVLTLT